MVGKESTDRDMKISLLERETIICFNEAEDLARVYTFNTQLINRVRSISQRTGVKVDIKDEGYGEVQFYIPKKWIKVRAPFKKNLSEEQREKLRKNFNEKFHKEAANE